MVIIMSVFTDYMTLIRPRIDAAIESAMYAWVEPFKTTINDVSGALPSQGYERPALLGDGDYDDDVGSNYVTITNVTVMQGSDYGVPEVDFVEQGLPNYNMYNIGPRPFMETAGQEFADGEGSRILQQYLDAI